MIRLLIADDHAIMRRCLKELFELEDDMQVAAEAANGTRVLELLRTGAFDLVLMDLFMPGMSGIDVIARIRLHNPKLPILVLTMCQEAQVIRRALKTGASGYLTKTSEPALLMTAIRKTAAGNRFIDPSLIEQMVFETDMHEAKPMLERLSNREFHILRLLASGMSANQIAEELTISNRTVSTHKARLMLKMNFDSNADLVRYAMANRLLD